MSVFRRGKRWYADFTVSGQRYKQSLHTTDWREALSREKELIAQASVGKLAPSSQRFAKLGFCEAADRYTADRLAHLAPRSILTEGERLKPMRAFFGATLLTRISADTVREYVAHRKGQKAANRTLNMELGILRRILKRAKRWHLIAEDCKPLPERREVGRALLHEQKVKLLKTAASRPEWQVARLAAVLALNTTMRACEIRGLRWRDLDLIERTITVWRSKTEAGERVIPLNADAWAAILELRERTQTLCGQPQPDWYVFPHGEGQGPVTQPKNRPGPEAVTVKPDPTKPMSTWRTAWRRLTRAIICPACCELQNPGETCQNRKCNAVIRGVESPLAGLRFHDLRHHAITELAEGQASDQTIRSIAGHVSLRMLEHYSHVRLDAKRKALGALSSGVSGVVTSQSTSQNPSASPQVTDKNGGRDRDRTGDPLLAKQVLSQLSYTPTFRH